LISDSHIFLQKVDVVVSDFCSSLPEPILASLQGPWSKFC